MSSSDRDGDLLQGVSRQGAGLINVYMRQRLFRLVSLCWMTRRILKDCELLLFGTVGVMVLMIWDDRQRFSVKSTGNDSKKYKLTHSSAGTALTVNAVRSSIDPQ